MDENDSFEKAPGFNAESVGERAVAPEQDFAKAFETGVPEFRGDGFSGAEVAGDKFGVANPDNLYYGEAKDEGDVEAGDAGVEFNEGVADAAALVEYGLNSAAQKLGVETVVQKIRGFDASGREDPIGDLFKLLELPAPAATGSHEGAFRALDDMKELIGEVEGADPRYEELRAGARAAGKGYFDYAVSQFGTQGMTELFGVLAEQREKKEVAKDDAGEEVGLMDGVLGVTAEDKAFKKELEGSGVRDGGLERETLNPEILRPQG